MREKQILGHLSVNVKISPYYLFKWVVKGSSEGTFISDWISSL